MFDGRKRHFTFNMYFIVNLPYVLATCFQYFFCQFNSLVDMLMTSNKLNFDHTDLSRPCINSTRFNNDELTDPIL